MHALDLMRELMSARDEAGQIDIPEGLVRTATLYKEKSSSSIFDRGEEAAFEKYLRHRMNLTELVNRRGSRPPPRMRAAVRTAYCVRRRPDRVPDGG